MAQHSKVYMSNIIKIAPEGSKTSGGTRATVGEKVHVGVVTVSDRASEGIYDDESGPAILNVGICM